MRILHISRTMGIGGAEKIVYELAKGIDSEQVVVASTGGYYSHLPEAEKIQFIEIPDLEKKDLHSIFTTLKILYRTIKNNHIDIVHSHHRMAAFYTKILSYFLNFNRIYTSHNIFNNKKKLLRYSLQGSSIIAVGDDVKKNLVDYYRIEENKIEVIHNCVSDKKTGNYNKQINDLVHQNKKIVLFIGRLEEQKGADIFLKSIALAAKTNKNLIGVIVGTGKEENNLKQLAKNLKIQNNILFLGFHNNILDIISQSLFVVLPSRWEGFPLTPLETFSQRKTIIASNIPGNNEIVIDKKNGLLFTKDNPEELSYCILELLNNPKLLQSLEKEAEITYLNKYSINQLLNQYKKIYQQLEK